MTVSLAGVPRRSDGTWSHDVDRLKRVLDADRSFSFWKANERFPRIPIEVLEHIFEERKRNK